MYSLNKQGVPKKVSSKEILEHRKGMVRTLHGDCKNCRELIRDALNNFITERWLYRLTELLVK